MSEKLDYYAVLGVAKTASGDDIKAAFKKIAMKCHPDMLLNKSEADKKAAGEKFLLAKEANEVLTDSSKRATYDQYGHKGLENIKSNGTSGRNQSYTDAIGTMKPKTAASESDLENFFTKRTGGSSSSSTDSDGLTSEQRRERNRLQRIKDREAKKGNSVTTPSVKETFSDVAEKVGDATELLKDAVLPVEVLERFRDNLQDFLNEVDAAIERSRKNGGPAIKP